jgi:hypothetical protein
MNSDIQKSMDYKKLLEEYQALLIENNRLKEKIESLNIQLRLEESKDTITDVSAHNQEHKELEQEFKEIRIVYSSITKNSSSAEKIKLYMSLFRGRDDVYAKRWENNKKGTAGYSPACGNEWKPTSMIMPIFIRK